MIAAFLVTIAMIAYLVGRQGHTHAANLRAVRTYDVITSLAILI